MGVVFGIIFGLVGLGVLVFPDFAWWFTERTNTMKGQVSERTSAWDTGRVISGVMLIGVGIFVAIALS
jgi:hypothetical protein